MNISNRIPFNFKRFNTKRFWCHFVLFSFLFFGLVCFIVKISRSSKDYPVENSNPIFDALKDCLTSAGIDGENVIHRDNGTKYKETNWQWNTVNGFSKPMAYVLANDVSDVQKAVICCQQLNVRVVPKSGGHSIVKNCFGDSNSLVIDLKRLNQISPDPKQMSCEIGPGALIAGVSYTLWKEGRFMIPAGICPTVGIAGLALGGGYGYFTRLFGLASDNLLELEMVDATGNVLTINNSTNVDLFWALRGAGGGSFGIVTKLKFRMRSVPKRITYSIYLFNFDDFSQFFKSLQSSIASDTIPNNIGMLTRMSKIGIEMELLKIDLHQGNDVNVPPEHFDVESLFRSFSFPNSTKSLTWTLSYPQFVLKTTQNFCLIPLKQFSQVVNLTRHAVVGMTKVKSFYVDEMLDNDQITKLKVLLSDHLKSGSLHIEHNAINNFTGPETAFVHRGNTRCLIQLGVFFGENKPIDSDAIVAMKKVYEASKAFLKHRESYQNYLDEDIPDYLQRFYGANLKKLVQVKMRIDPGNVFHHPHSIPTHL